jgi:hypothetical protein
MCPCTCQCPWTRGHGQGHMYLQGYFVRHCWWRTSATVESQGLPGWFCLQYVTLCCLSTFYYTGTYSMFCPIRRFVPFDGLSHSTFFIIQHYVPFGLFFYFRRYVYSAFCHIQHFVLLTFCTIRHFVIRHFVPFDVFLFDNLYVRCLLLHTFVAEPLLVIRCLIFYATGPRVRYRYPFLNCYVTFTSYLY